MKNLRKELFRMRLEFDIIQQVQCSNDEEKHIKHLIKTKHPLPDDIHYDNDGTYYRYVNSDISKEDMEELLLYRQLKYLKTIKNCMIFFVFLTILPFIVAIFLLNIH